MHISDIRRHNLRALAKTIGGISELARLLGKSQAQLSHLIGKHPRKNIGHKIARQVETTFKMPIGWLDKEPAFISSPYCSYFINCSIQFGNAAIIFWKPHSQENYYQGTSMWVASFSFEKLPI